MLSNDEFGGALKRFQGSLSSGRLGHAYLVVGDPRGNALQLAQTVLQMLFCVETGNHPCGACSGCQRVARRVHPDVLWLEPMKRSRGILVEQIEEVIRHIFQTTFEGGWKAVALVSAERMNQEAANKLLKTLEEPPARSIFFLLSDQPEALLPTILSRCQRVVLAECLPQAEDELYATVAKIAEGVGHGDMTARLVKAREMVVLFNALKEQADKDAEEWLEKYLAGAEQTDDLEEIEKGRAEALYRERRRRVLQLFLLWQRDLMLCACGLENDRLFFRAQADTIRAASAGLTYWQAVNNINVVEKMRACLDQYLPELIITERAFLQLARAFPGAALEDRNQNGFHRPLC